MRNYPHTQYFSLADTFPTANNFVLIDFSPLHAILVRHVPDCIDFTYRPPPPPSQLFFKGA